MISDTHDAETLLPCPFCGSEPRSSVRVDEDLSTHSQVEWHTVECSEDFDCTANPSISIPNGYEGGTAQERWNTRHALPPQEVSPVGFAEWLKAVPNKTRGGTLKTNKDFIFDIWGNPAMEGNAKTIFDAGYKAALPTQEENGREAARVLRKIQPYMARRLVHPDDKHILDEIERALSGEAT